DETLRAAENLARFLGIRHHILSFRDLFRSDLDTLVPALRENPCTICGVLRRRALELAARRIGATRLATGHTLDDEAQSALMNLLRGDLRRLVQDSGTEGEAGLVPRIKPLSVITEKEVVTFLIDRGHYLDLPDCPMRNLPSGQRSGICWRGSNTTIPGPWARFSVQGTC
ncbi:MAG: tRNA 2-thiocytidine biosynthesis TtcA family protein, partial [Methanomicrobiaceae archaeon]|nr:tRNA 2-thiocytidine biosynthesis TtcA family protein [Methanomicrobiaceae archaeon]